MANRITTLIVDDEKRSRNTIALMLTDYCPNIEILGLAKSAAEGIDMIKELKPQLVLLDVEMPYGSGFDILREIEVINFEVIFITGFDHYALQAIKFNALDYILKPVDIDELVLAISKVERQIDSSINNDRLRRMVRNIIDKKNQQLVLPGRDGHEFISISEIVYCEADGPCTWFHLSNGRKILASKNLGEYEKLLPSPDNILQDIFFRTHYKYLVNIKYVTGYHYGEKRINLSTGKVVEVAFRRSKTFRKILDQTHKKE